MNAGKRRRPLLLALLIAALLAAMFGCTSSQESADIMDTQTVAPVATPEAVQPTPDIPVTETSPEITAAAIPIEDINGVAGPDDILPTIESYEEAKAANSDVVGWITVPNTKIDYPVVRGTDNEFYLVHNIEKQKSSYGSIFMDYRNADPLQQRHIILHGHRMKNGTMFHDLNNYKQRSFFEQNRVITLIWDGVQTKWEVFAAFVWPGDNSNVYETRFYDDQDFANYMKNWIDFVSNLKYSIVEKDVTIQPSDQVLTLSTCTYEYDNSRYLVSARRIQ
jgi:sortase B